MLSTSSIIKKASKIAFQNRSNVCVDVCYSGRFDNYNEYQSCLQIALLSVTLADIQAVCQQDFEDYNHSPVKELWLGSLARAAEQKAKFNFHLPDHVSVALRLKK